MAEANDVEMIGTRYLYAGNRPYGVMRAQGAGQARTLYAVHADQLVWIHYTPTKVQFRPLLYENLADLDFIACHLDALARQQQDAAPA